MDTKIVNVELVMWEKTMMAETSLEDGKRIKTGKQVEMTTYTFRDEFGSKLVFLSTDSNFRRAERKHGDLFVKLGYDDFKKQNRVRFVGFQEEEN